MSPAHRNLALAIVALLALGAGVFAARLWSLRAATPQLASGILLPEARPLAAFALTDQDGRPFTPERLRGHWTLLFAGFTHCPDVCPTTLALLKQLGARLEPQRRGFAPLFLSLDPQRDTPDRLRSYVRHFGETLTGVTGTTEELERLCANLGLAYVKVPGASEADYTIDHSAALVLLNPDGAIAGYFQAPHKLDALADDLARVIAPS